MKCKRVNKDLPLLAAQDLSIRRSRRLQKHLDSCAACREELGEYKAALQGIKELAEKEKMKSWGEAEWKDAIRRATSEAFEPRKSALKVLPGPAWAYGLAFLILAGLAVLFLRTIVLKPKGLSVTSEKTIVKQIERPQIPPKQEPAPVVITKTQKPRTVPVQIPQKIGLPEAAKTQDAISVTLVSKETGLKVTWVFDKNFEWKGEEK